MVFKTTSPMRLEHFLFELKMYEINISYLVVLVYASILGVYAAERPRQFLKYGGKIVGGTETTIQKHPYQVYLLIDEASTGYTYQCGGSIVKNRCIITAAHCLSGMKSAHIRAGSAKADSGGSTYSSRMLHTHPRYNRSSTDFDIGVIKLSTPIKLDGKNTSTITFPGTNCEVTPGSNLTVTGWGTTEESGSVSPILMAVTVDAVSSDECKQKYPDLTPRMICAGVPGGGKDSCQGDSGGPLVKTGTKIQVGVVSFGIGCARPDTPGVYTNLCNADIQRWLRTMSCA